MTRQDLTKILFTTLSKRTQRKQRAFEALCDSSEQSERAVNILKNIKVSFSVDTCFKFNQLLDATISGSGRGYSNTNDQPCERGTECDWLHAAIWTD